MSIFIIFSAFGYALTNPSDIIWEQYYNEIQKLVKQDRLPEEESLLLLYSSEVRAAIMDVTKGGEIAPNESNIFEIIAKAKDRLTYSERDEIKKLKSKLDESIKFQEQNIEKGKQIDSLEKEVVSQKQMRKETDLKINKISYKISNISSWIITSIPIIFIIIAILNFVKPPC